jgi:hypothetical protein
MGTFSNFSIFVVHFAILDPDPVCESTPLNLYPILIWIHNTACGVPSLACTVPILSSDANDLKLNINYPVPGYRDTNTWPSRIRFDDLIETGFNFEITSTALPGKNILL